MVSRKERSKYEKIDNEAQSNIDENEGQEEDLEMQEENPKKEIENFTIKIKSPDDKIHEVEIQDSTNVKDLKLKVEELTTIEPVRQRLIHFGKMINQKPDETLIKTLVKHGDFIHLVPLPKNVAASTTSPPTGNSNPAETSQGMEGINLEDLMNLTSLDYFGRVELSLWRARVRLLTSMMLFYYFLQCMGNLSIWIHPEELDQRFQHGHHPSTLFFSLDLVEAILGVSAALAGMKAANSDDPLFSLNFLRNIIELCLIHFVAFSIYYKELIDGNIKLRPQFHYGDDQEDNGDDLTDDEIVASVFFSFGINIVVWWTIISIASRFHRSLVGLQVLERAEPQVDTEEQSIDQVV